MRKMLSFSHAGIRDGQLYGEALKRTGHEDRVACFKPRKSLVFNCIELMLSD